MAVDGVAPVLMPVVPAGLLLLALTTLTRSRSGSRPRLDGPAGGAMLTELQDRVLRRSAAPLLPAGWHLDLDLRAARGESFSGDFVVSAAVTAPGAPRLDVVLADVSGQGLLAGGRALLLAAALEALLEVVPRDDFLAAANQHVLRHGDDDGFATALRVSVDLGTGAFVLAGAGHPPAAHYRAGAGRWTLLDGDQGPALGLLPDARYPSTSGVLRPGDALLLYTDGLVENRRLDVWRGIDRLIGHADALLAKGLPSVAAPIAEAIRAEEGDDRALVVIRRA
jgi:serine phosphatase RsbU (regulator of sigma subunit)